MLLREATVVHSCQTESLLYVINAVLRYWGYSGHLARFLLDKYTIGEYAKKLVAQESLDNFTLMPYASQRLYLDVLMEDKHHLACQLPYTRYMIAYRLNYAKGKNGNEVIDNREFFMKLSQISSFEISPYRYDEFVDLSNIVSLVAQYSNQHPDDKVIDTLSKAQAIKYLTACYDYFDKHLNVCPIEEGSCKPGLLRKVYLRQELKGKTPDEQMVIRYLDLYDGLEYHMNDNGKFKSEWCEKEEQLFHEIISTLTDKDTEAQNRISSTLWRVIYWGYWGEKMPYDDIKAERLMALKPFLSQDDYVEAINSYYKDCAYDNGKVTISVPSVLDGLNIIRTLFEQSKEYVKVYPNGQPTAFIDILIAIYKMKEEITLVHHG